MSALSRKLVLGLLALGTCLVAPAAPNTPYLETIPATINWQFYTTGVGKARVAQPAATNVIVENPDTINPTDRVTTETGAPIIYAGGTGNQAFFVQQLLRKVLDRYAEDTMAYLAPAAAYKAQAAEKTAQAAQAYSNADAATVAGNTTAAADYKAQGDALTAEAAQLIADADALIAQAEPTEQLMKRIKRQLNDQWELTFVRAPQTTAQGVMTTPYWLFLTKIDSTQDRNIIGLDTGLRLTPKYTAGTASEASTSGTLGKVSGSLTTYFTLDFSHIYAADPLSGIASPGRGLASPGTTVDALIEALRNGDLPTASSTANYNTSGSFWRAYGSGYLTYGLRKIGGTVNGVAPTKLKVSGFGSWAHLTFNLTSNEFALYDGTAPLGMKLGEVKYQRSEYFPEYTPVAP